MPLLKKYCLIFLIPLANLFSVDSHAQSFGLKDSLFYEIVNQLMVFDTLPNKHKAAIDTVGGKMIISGTYSAYIYKEAIQPHIEDHNLNDMSAFNEIWEKAVKKYFKKTDLTFAFNQLEDTSTFIIDEKCIADIRVDLSEKPLKIINYIKISKPIFNGDYKKAFISVAVQKKRDYECRTYLVKKTNEKWKLEKLICRKVQN
ncbi:MAG: hypothetical protein CVU05_05745 [Bacteroidetes bacterium HGW-Bacteroidetes-21]|jgi:hypothetical protein|nr:MAG: hypothetical protein CVU05_05745 [Bacteroidetes bacterium HGW-Bacteroidetes-21]